MTQITDSVAWMYLVLASWLSLKLSSPFRFSVRVSGTQESAHWVRKNAVQTGDGGRGASCLIGVRIEGVATVTGKSTSRLLRDTGEYEWGNARWIYSSSKRNHGLFSVWCPMRVNETLQSWQNHNRRFPRNKKKRETHLWHLRSCSHVYGILRSSLS